MLTHTNDTRGAALMLSLEGGAAHFTFGRRCYIFYLPLLSPVSTNIKCVCVKYFLSNRVEYFKLN